MKAIRIDSCGAHIRLHDIAGTGDPIVFIHGLGCASSCDYPVVVADAALRGRRALLIDLLGSGFSDKPANYPYTISAHAAAVVEVLHRLEVERAHLFGHSMGGSVAIEAAALFEPRLTSLTVSEPNLDAGGGIFSRAIAAQSEAQYCARGHAAYVEDAGSSNSVIWAGSMAVSAPHAVYRAALSLVEGGKPSWRESLVALKVPRTVLFGERSLPDPNYESLPQQGVGVRVVAAAGHSMAWENPSGLAAAIRDSLP